MNELTSSSEDSLQYKMKEELSLTLQRLKEENNQLHSLIRIESEQHLRWSIEIALLHYEIEQRISSRENFETPQAAVELSQEDLHHRIQLLEKHIEQLTSSHLEEKLSYYHRIKELNNKIQEIENSRSSLFQELQYAQSVCRSLDADNSSLKERLNEAKFQLNVSKQEIKFLQDRLESRDIEASRELEFLGYGALGDIYYIPGFEELPAEPSKGDNNEKSAAKNSEDDSKDGWIDVSNSEARINKKSGDDEDIEDKEGDSEGKKETDEEEDSLEENDVMNEEEGEKENNSLADVDKRVRTLKNDSSKSIKDAKEHKKQTDDVDDEQKEILTSQSGILSRKEYKMLKTNTLAREVQFAKGKKRKLDVGMNYKKENVSLKDIEKLHKKAKTDKLTRVATDWVNESNDDALNINSLPDEVILEIFSYLKQNELGQIARVCRRWNVLTWSPVLWKKVNVKFSSSDRSPTAITKTFINRLPSCVTSIKLDFIYHWIGKLDFMKLCMRLQENCPHLEELFFTYSKFSCSFSSAIDLCIMYLQDLKKLVFCSCVFPDCRSTGEWGGISKIEVLNVFDCGSDYNGPLNKPPFSKMPYLRRLQLFGSTIEDSWFDDNTSFLNQLHVLSLGYTEITSATFTAIQSHGHNLKELCLCLVNLQDRDLNINNSVFPQLKTICLRHCDDITCEGVISLLQSCHSLQDVYVGEDLAESFEEHPFVAASRCKSGIVKDTECGHGEEADSF